LRNGRKKQSANSEVILLGGTLRYISYGVVGPYAEALCHIGEAQDKNGNPDPKGEVRLFAAPGKTVAAAGTRA
jgi:hypothetical protein